MKTKVLLVTFIVLLVTALGVVAVAAQGPSGSRPEVTLANAGTAFTYQGQLKRGGSPYNGTCSMQFSLYDAASGGTQIGTTQGTSGVTVTNGLFTTPIDFGAGAFDGNRRFLQIAVMCGSDGGYTPLTPLQELTPTPMALALPNFYTQQNGWSPNIIGGYSGNTVAASVSGATISGGGQPAAINQASSNSTTISGGFGNTASGQDATVGGGAYNTASGIDAVVCGGGSNTASQLRAVVSGGFGNTASEPYTTVSGGIGNTASSRYATVPGGSGAVASHYGELAYANGIFATPGDAQTSVYVLRDSVMGSNTAELFLDGNSQRLTLADNRTVTFDILVVGRSAAGVSAGYQFRGVIQKYNGTTSLVGGPNNNNKQVLAEGDATMDANVTADNANSALKITATGSGLLTSHWVATVRTVEVEY